MSRNASPEQLWLHSREPIRQPLLKKLLGNADLSHLACLAFTDILRHDMAFCTFKKTKQQAVSLFVTFLQLIEEWMLSGYVKDTAELFTEVAVLDQS